MRRYWNAVNHSPTLAGRKSPLIIDLLHKSHNAPVAYPTMHHFVTGMCTHTCVHISVTKVHWGLFVKYIVGFMIWVYRRHANSCAFNFCLYTASNTVQYRYNTVMYITRYCVQHQHYKDRPYIGLWHKTHTISRPDDELWGVYWVHFLENRPCCNDSGLHQGEGGSILLEALSLFVFIIRFV